MSRISHKDLLYSYFLNEQCRLEDDVEHLRTSLRYKNIDPVDCLEYMLAVERLNNFCKFHIDVTSLLNINNDWM